MKTSAAGRALIEQREGKRLAAYRDVKGILTIGVGHTGRMSPPPVTAGMRITDEQCDALLAGDLAPVEAAIADAVKLPLSQNEFDALASLGFNIGTGGLRGSAVVRQLNLGDLKGAADAFMHWSKPPSLAGRRRTERAQFLTPDVPDPAPARALAAQRAATLATAQAATTDRSRVAGAAATTLLAAGAVAAPLAHHGPHPLAWLAVFGLAALGLAAAFVAIAAGRAAKALAVNADRHAAAAAPTSPIHTS